MDTYLFQRGSCCADGFQIEPNFIPTRHTVRLVDAFRRDQSMLRSSAHVFHVPSYYPYAA
jgi:hypothetical protein